MELTRNSAPSASRRVQIRLTLLAVVGLAVWFAARPVAASEEATTAAHGTDLLHLFLELLQLFAGAITVGTAYLAVTQIRGGHIEWAFYALTAGVVTFLGQRLWHSIHEFGFVSMPTVAEQTLILLATVLMSVGFVQTYRVMNPSR